MTQDTIILLHTYNTMMEATMAYNKLKEEGINCFLENQNAMGLNPLGGVELKVFAKDKAEAEKIIEE